MAEDPELLRQYVETSSQEAFGELVGRYIDFVYGVAMRYSGNAQWAEDATQVVFINLARKARALCQRNQLAGWLYITARYAAANIVRGEFRRQKYEREVELMEKLTSNSDPVVDWSKAGPALDHALADLGESDRTAVLLRYFRNCSFSKVGELTGISEEAARKRVGRGLEHLREHLAKRGIASTAAAITFALEGQAGLAAPAGLAASVTGSALAKAAAVSGPAFSLLQFMITTKLTVGGAVLAALFAVGLTLRESGIVSAATAEYLAKEKDYQVLLTQVQQLRQSDRSAEQEVSDLKAAIASARAKTARDARTRRNSGTAPSSADKEAKRGHALLAAGPNWKLSGDPQVQGLLRTSQTAAANAIFGRFFSQMGWSPSQIAAFDELWLYGDINLNYAILTLRPESESQPQNNQNLQQLLGSDWPQFLQYWKNSYVQTVATGLAGNLYATDSPLTAQQADQLTSILAADSQSSLTYGWAFPGQVNWEAALPQAQKVLSPAQYQVLQNEAAIISSQNGLWAGVNPLIPGMIGASTGPPPSVLAVSKTSP